MRYVLRVHLFMRVYRVRNFGRAGETAGMPRFEPQ